MCLIADLLKGQEGIFLFFFAWGFIQISKLFLFSHELHPRFAKSPLEYFQQPNNFQCHDHEKKTSSMASSENRVIQKCLAVIDAVLHFQRLKRPFLDLNLSKGPLKNGSPRPWREIFQKFVQLNWFPVLIKLQTF